MNRPKTFYLSPYLGISAKPSFLGIADYGKKGVSLHPKINVTKSNIDK